jgi:hypothetical protein
VVGAWGVVASNPGGRVIRGRGLCGLLRVPLGSRAAVLFPHRAVASCGAYSGRSLGWGLRKGVLIRQSLGHTKHLIPMPVSPLR